MTPEVLERPRLGYLEMQGNATTAGFKADVTSFASASHSKKNTKVTTMKTERSTIFQLANSGRWFTTALKDSEARHWIEEVIGIGEAVYVVVGYQTMINAEISGDLTKAKRLDGRIQLLISKVVSATASLTIGELVDPVVEVSHQKERGVRKQFVAAREQVYAVQYRKVQFKWYSSRNLDRAALEKGSRWRVYGKLRREAAESNDVIEATISDNEAEDEDVSMTLFAHCNF
jgi:hypothetical protein